MSLISNLQEFFLFDVFLSIVMLDLRDPLAVHTVLKQEILACRNHQVEEVFAAAMKYKEVFPVTFQSLFQPSQFAAGRNLKILNV